MSDFMSHFAVPIAIGAVAVSALTPRDAEALPKYAQKEKKPCAFCHVNPKGGGKKTAAGEYYKAHDHTLVGYKEGGAPSPSPKPSPKASPKPKPKASPKAKMTGKTAKPKPRATPTPKKST